jgi:hypothetical protein
MSGLPPYTFQNALDLLELLCEELELTESQRQAAERSYATVGEWLNAPGSAIARYSPHIHAQGSIALGTTVRPHNRADFDIDLVCLLEFLQGVSAAELFRLVHDRLNEHGTYTKMISRKNRCVRLDYQPDYHLDITPAMPHRLQGTHIYVPDRALATLKDSNPKGYIDWFLAIGRRMPNIRRMLVLANEMSNRATVEPLTLQQSFEKKPLQRIVQILKRHRDLHFEKSPDIAVISVTITTLTAISYERLVGREFETTEDFVEAVVRDLPNGLQRRQVGAAVHWWLPNPSSPGENFAEKWNDDPRKKTAFDQWHASVLVALDDVLRPKAAGLHTFAAANSRLMGEKLVNRAMESHGKRMLSLQDGGKLAVSTGAAGLVLGTTSAARAMPVRSNTYFGA